MDRYGFYVGYARVTAHGYPTFLPVTTSINFGDFGRKTLQIEQTSELNTVLYFTNKFPSKIKISLRTISFIS